MAIYDRDTWEFMEKIGAVLAPPPPSPLPKEEQDRHKTNYVKNTKTILKILQNPTKTIPKVVLKGALDLGFKKEAGLTPIGLFAFMNDHYSAEWWDWEPETVRESLEEDHQIVPTPEVMNMIGALQLTALTNAPFEHWDKFEKVGHAFYHNVVDFRVVQPMEPDEVALTFHYLALLRPGQEFQPEIYAYAAACCNEAGLVYLPPGLFPEACQEALAAQAHTRELEEEVKLQRAGGEFRPAPSDACAHQLAMLKEIQEALADA